MGKHKILEAFGIKEYPWNSWRNHSLNIKNRIKWWWQRRTIGFDSRECYDLDHTLLLLILERLVQFKKDSSKIIAWEDSPKITYNEQEYSVLDFIDLIIDKIQFLLYLGKYRSRNDEDLRLDMVALDEEDNKAYCEILDMLKAGYRFLWW